MGGFSSITGQETIMFADNASFDGTDRGGRMTTDGQLWIGSTAAPHVRAALPTAIQASTTPVMQAVYGNGSLAYENRAWFTQYVVDPNSTPGLRGTFQTIQAAINQVVADGYTFQPFHVIYIRPGTYIENLVFPNGVGISLQGQGPNGAIDQTLGAVIQGNATFAGGGLGTATFNNIQFTNGGSGNSLDTTGAAICTLNSCNIDTIIGSGAVTFFNCNINACTLTGSATLWECSFGGSICVFGAAASIYRCNCGNMQVTGSGNITIEDCYFSQAGFIGSTGSFTGNIFASNIRAGSQGLFAVNGGNIFYSNLTSYYSFATNRFFVTGFTPTSTQSFPQLGGNVSVIRKTAVDTSVTRSDQYIGVTDTSAPRTITLPGGSPASTAFFVGQKLTVKDETGGAATNNITISGPIDGGSSAVINTNYGSLDFIYDGTNYFIT